MKALPTSPQGQPVINGGTVRTSPDECLPGDWILAEIVPEWGPDGIATYVHPTPGHEFKRFVRRLRPDGDEEKDAWLCEP